MSVETFREIAQAVLNIEGVYLHSLTKFTHGKISLNKSGDITTPIRLPLKDLGSRCNDLRAAHAPHCYDNDLVPMICFLAPAEYMAAKRIGEDAGIAAVWCNGEEGTKQ